MIFKIEVLHPHSVLVIYKGTLFHYFVNYQYQQYFCATSIDYIGDSFLKFIQDLINNIK